MIKYEEKPDNKANRELYAQIQRGQHRQEVMFASARIYFLQFILGRYVTRYFSWGAEQCIR